MMFMAATATIGSTVESGEGLWLTTQPSRWKPSDQQQQHADAGEGERVPGDGIGGAVLIVFADARADEEDGDGGANGGADMNDGGSAGVDKSALF